jgi:hypothetical protein
MRSLCFLVLLPLVLSADGMAHSHALQLDTLEDTNVTFVEEKLVSIPVTVAPPEIDLAGFTMQQESNVQALVRSGSLFIEPFVNFLQGVFASIHPPLQTESPQRRSLRGFTDRRKIYVV